MEAVEHEPHCRMAGAAHGLPGVAVVADVASPSQRLEADAQAALAGSDTELVEVGGRAIDAADALRRDIGANEQQTAAEFLHDVELALGTGKRARALVPGHALEIPERLECHDLHAEVGNHPAHVARRAIERQQVVLEDFDAFEPCCRNRLEFLGEPSSQTHRSNGQFHGTSSQLAALRGRTSSHRRPCIAPAASPSITKISAALNVMLPWE
jgi:hypothetical protein